jgi:hypothetical protein
MTMPMKHRLSKTRELRITPAARSIFRRRQELKQQCICAKFDYCPFCLDREELEEQLSQELQLRCYQWPTIVHPDEKCPYPPATGGATWWPQAQALYRALDAA